MKAGEGGLVRDSVVLLEQIRRLDKHRLRERAGQIDTGMQQKVNEALEISFGLSSL
ncbi:MAG: type II toxin-antitoxin system PemK/MazF family toxin [Ruthenibacterium sp.]